MKFKFVASKKDIVIFLMFALFLLYVVALVVLNLPQLASEGTFYGLNPLEAFSPEYFVYTLVFYLLALGGLILSVSSYFFEFDSGFGFSVNKASGGYSDWAKDKDIKSDTNIERVLASDKTSNFAGTPLICNGKELWVDNGEYHTLVIGATGAGKTQDVIFPTIKVLAKKGESLICTDPKGELYEKTGDILRKRGYNIILLNFRNPQNGNTWNPLSLPYKLYKNGNQDKAIELLDDLALNILYDESAANNDPFWEKTAADYFCGIALAMFEDTEEEKININSINMTATVGEDKFGGSTYIKEYFNYKDPSSAAYVNASGTVMAPSDTKGGIISVFKQKVKLFASRENLSEMLSYSDFDLDSIGKQKTAVFIIIQDEKKTYHSLATIFIKQVYETLIDVAQTTGNGKLPIRTNFLLDEFANMPPLKDVTTMITAARSRQIRFTLIIQNFAQLNKVYGKDDAETIKGNCGNIIYLISTELAALEEISKLCGEKKSKKDAKTASTPLATVSDLQRMKQFDHIVLRLRKSPFKTSFVPDFKIDWGGEKSEKIDYPQREKKEVKIFDIREFVKEKKNQKINEMMASIGGGTPGSTGSSNISGASSAGGGFKPPMPMDKPNISSQPKPDLSVNDLVKKIDQKLAEIEKQEQEEKKKASSLVSSKNVDTVKTTPPNSLVYDDDGEDDFIDVPYVSPIKKEANKVELNNRKVNDDFFISPEVIERKVNEKLNSEMMKSSTNTNTSTSVKTLSNVDDELLNSQITDIKNSLREELKKDVKSSIDAELLKNNLMNEDLREKIVEDVKTEVNSNLANYELETKMLKNEIKNDIKAEIKEEFKENLGNDKCLYKPTVTIKLDDVADDDKFFDDFFDD